MPFAPVLVEGKAAALETRPHGVRYRTCAAGDGMDFWRLVRRDSHINRIRVRALNSAGINGCHNVNI